MGCEFVSQFFNIYRKFLNEFGLSKDQLLLFLNESPKKYKVYKIPKRTFGYRTIAQPTPELKRYQRFLVNELGMILPTHQIAMAYQCKKSIKDNALAHKNNNYFLKMDFSNFFNSITPRVFWQACDKTALKADFIDKILIERLLFWQESKYFDTLVLSIGAPSSPFISNFCLYEFDVQINDYCKSKGITCTRYADDLSFSTNEKNILFNLPEVVEGMLKEIYDNQIIVNTFKTAYSSRKHNRHVTGLTITNDNKISIGRQKKRYIRSLVYTMLNGNISESDMKYLQGYISFIQHVEPNFLESLKRKHSPDVIEKIRNS